MNKSVIRHLLTAAITVLGFIPGTKVLMPVVDYISTNLDNVWAASGVIVTSIIGLISAYKYGRDQK